MKLALTKHSLTSDAAQAIAAAAVKAAQLKSMAIGVCVSDAEGAPLALIRMDGVGAPIVEFCQEKAYTSAVTGAATSDFYKHMSSTASLAMGMTGRPRFLVWGGGLPIRQGNVLLGGIGVSGGSEEQDIKLAEEALAAIGLGPLAAENPA